MGVHQQHRVDLSALGQPALQALGMRDHGEENVFPVKFDFDSVKAEKTPPPR
ncbi:hypothetical protein [Nonomuraea sp. NPDC003754]